MLAGFFRTGRAKQSLALLGKWNTGGWEKWWQHELVMHLIHRRRVAGLEPELQVPVTARKIGGAAHMRFDIAVQFRRYTPKSWFLLELKQSQDFRVCLRGMKRDMSKFTRADRSYLQGLGRMAYAGVIPSHEEDEDIRDYADDLFDDVWYPEMTMTIRRIGAHHKLLVV